MKLENLSKQELRKKLLFVRKTVLKRADKNSSIFASLINMPQFVEAKQVLMYMALDDEVNVDALLDLIKYNEKSIAVPYCIDKEGNMDFYYINSTDDLVLGSYGIREPDITKCKKVCDFDDSLILVPAIAFDSNGFRLGYGKGYYDRFLQKHSITSVGLCYNSLVLNKLPIDEYDQSVDYIVTENRIISVKNGGQNGQS